MRPGARHRGLESALLVVHVAGYLALLLTALTWRQAIAFGVVHQAVFGIYLGCSFAPGHKGMPNLDTDQAADPLLRQVLTSRNLRGGLFVDYALGGLNYQIEHHLFPSMPRPNLRHAQVVVRRFSPRGAKRLVGDAVRTTRRLVGETRLVLVRMDSAFYGRGPDHAALAGGAAVSVTVRMDKAVKKAIATIPDHARTTIEYTDAVFDETTGRWISRAEVAELGFTAFGAQKKSEQVPGRLVVRRIPEFNAEAHKAAGQDSLFDVRRFHAFFTTADPKVLDTVAADETHRHHAVIEQVHADLKNSALAQPIPAEPDRPNQMSSPRAAA